MPTPAEVRTWYNRHYAARGLEGMRPPAAYPIVLDLLDVRRGTALLDVSCGPGLLLAAARARGLTSVGVDLSDEAVRVARNADPGARLAVALGEHLCFRDATFDYVTCLGSLEHFGDIDLGLREMRRVAKPSARLCIMVPNARFLGWRLLGRQGTAQQAIKEQLLGLDQWRTIFTRAGLHVERVVPDLWHAVKWRHGQGRGMERWLGPLLEMAWRVLPLGRQYQFVFLLRQGRAHASGRDGRPAE